jgi:glycosyltransferase involved in cell wall biosynthesis
MDIILISTTDMKGGRADLRDRMLQSLVESQLTLSKDRMVLELLLQNCPSEKLNSGEIDLPSFVRPVAMEGRAPLSTARNILLRRVASDGAIPPDAVVAFPDDDCWYPPGFLAQVAGLFSSDPSLDFWFCRYSTRPTGASFAAEAPVIARTREVVRNASSNTIFLRGRVVAAIGEFDEELGVGTPMGGAEDLDYALRARRIARKVAFCDASLVGHRDKQPEIRARYYMSNLVVLARHARNGASKSFLRSIAVGIYLSLRRELPVRKFAEALTRALESFRRGNGDVLRPFKKLATRPDKLA